MTQTGQYVGPENIKPAAIRKHHFNRSDAAPATGNYEVGDIVYNTTPTAGGNIGWVCITAGKPGTWKEFGTIAS